MPNKHMAILTHKIGKDLEPGVVIAPSQEYKGVQKDVLTEGRYYYNPYAWDWQVVPQVEIPEGKLGVRIRMYGEDLAAGELIAWKENQKGIVPEVLRPGRYPINAVVERGDSRRTTSAELCRNRRTARSDHDSRRLQGAHHRSHRRHAEAGQRAAFGQGRAGRAIRDAWSRARTI